MRRYSPNQTITATTSDGLMFERYCYGPGPAGVTYPHVHDTYQLCLSVNFVGEYHLGSAVHPVPVGSVSIVPPGQVHAARDPVDRPHPSLFLVAYLPPERLATVVTEWEDVVGRDAWPGPVCDAPWLRTDFSRLCHAALEDAPRLERDERLLAAVISLGRAARGTERLRPAVGREQRAVTQAREYLQAHVGEQVALADLANVTGLSAFRLARAFRADVGMPPHAYHLAVRIDCAKHLLLSGLPAARVATVTGFCDQSHLTRHFRRLVGVPPGHYTAKGKNVQDVRR